MSTAVASPSSSSDHAPTAAAAAFMPALSALPASFFSSLPPPATFFATLLAHHQNALQPIPVPPPVVPPPPPPQTPTSCCQPQQTATPRSISPVPPGIYCDLGPAMFERTSRGYTVLRFEGYSFSKISDNRTKTYWRCANRTCRAKIHTNGGRIVYIGREPHVHKPRTSASSGMAKAARPIKPIQQQQPMMMMLGLNSFIQQQQQRQIDTAPLDLRPKKEPSSLVIFDDDKDLHSNSNSAATKSYEESAPAKSSSSACCAELDDELEIEGDDEADLLINSTPAAVVSSKTSLIRTPPSSPSSTTSSESPSAKKRRHLAVDSMMMTSPSVQKLPRSTSEVELFRLLQRANLMGYYDVFMSHGGDDVQQLVEANEAEFAEILRLVDMTSKPLHVRRLQKVLAEWVANPASFQVPLTAAEMAATVNKPPPAPQPVKAILSPRHLGAGEAALSLMMMSAAKTAPDGHPANAPMNLSIVSHTAYPTASSSSSSGSPSVFFASNNKASALPSSTLVHPAEEEASPGDFAGGDQDSETSSSYISSEPPNSDGLLMLKTAAKPVATLTSELRSQLVQAAAATVAKYPDLLSLAPRTDLTNARMKASEVQQLLALLDMPRDHLDYLDGVQRFSMIFGRFDAKRKHPERSLSFHELSVNEASAALCLLLPALLTHRERLYHLARQTVRDVIHHAQPSPSPTNIDRSSFATPPPMMAAKPQEGCLKRKPEIASSDSPVSKRSVITESGEIVFPSSTSSQQPDEDNKQSIAVSLAKQFGFPDLVDELQQQKHPEDE